MDSSEISISSVIKSAVTDTIEVNASFQSSAGIRAKIKRVAHAGCCDACAALEGEWYYDEAPDDVYWRHGNCTCTVTYDPGTGKVQNVHTKAWSRAEEIDKIKKRKNIGLQSENVTADSRDKYDEIPNVTPQKIQQGISCFPEGTTVEQYVRQVKPDGDFFDVALHGSENAVAYGTETTNMSPRLLAEVIRRSDGYSGQPIRLLSCYTGHQTGSQYCFAEELSNILGVEVKAPNDVLRINYKGEISVGRLNSGEMVTFTPNQRRRLR